MLVNALNQYSPDQKFSSTRNRLALIAVAGEFNTAIVNNFNDSEGKTAQQMFDNLQKVYDSGQDVSAAVAATRNLSSTSLGYRSSSTNPNVRHLAIYISFSGTYVRAFFKGLDFRFTGNGEAANDVSALKRSGMFGWATIGWNNTYYVGVYHVLSMFLGCWCKIQLGVSRKLPLPLF